MHSLPERLSALTGVNETHIEMFVDGSMAPDESHTHRIDQAMEVIGDTVNIASHGVILPNVSDMVHTRRGESPDGTEIMKCQVDRILPGDMIPLVPRTYGSEMSRSGQYWMVVEKVKTTSDSVSITFAGGIQSHNSSSSVATVARKSN